MSQACEEHIKALPKDIDSLTSFSYPSPNDGTILGSQRNIPYVFECTSYYTNYCI